MVAVSALVMKSSEVIADLSSADLLQERELEVDVTFQNL